MCIRYIYIYIHIYIYIYIHIHTYTCIHIHYYRVETRMDWADRTRVARTGKGGGLKKGKREAGPVESLGVSVRVRTRGKKRRKQGITTSFDH